MRYNVAQSAGWKAGNRQRAQALRVAKSPKERTQKPKNSPKITLPTFEKLGIQEAKLWWRRCTQYIQMTQNIDLNKKTTDREI